jgi:hypothetical protein
MPSARLALALVAGSGLVACGTETPPEVVVTVTQAPGSRGSDSFSSSGSSASTTADVPTSEVKGRRFDFGLVLRAERVGDTDVLVIDRWTDPKVDDDTLAEHGLEVGTWQLGSNRYLNQNAKVTFDIPVRDGTTFLLHHCVRAGEPLETRSVTATELAAAPASDRLALVQVDQDGWATSGETLAGC